MTATDPEQVRRTFNHWNATRHGWTRFQASNRRAAERLAFADPAADLDTITTQPEPTGPASTDRSPMEPRAGIHAMFATDDETAAKLDTLLNAYRKEITEIVLHLVEQEVEDITDRMQENSVTLAAWLDGRDAD